MRSQEQIGQKEELLRKKIEEIAVPTALAAIAAVQEGELRREERDYIAVQASYGQGSLRLSHERVRRKAWDDYGVWRIVDLLKERLLVEFESCAIELSNAGGREASVVRGDLTMFLSAVVVKSAESGNCGCVEELSERLVYEILGGDLTWIGRIWLSGISVEDGPIEMGDGLLLRSPRSEDFYSEYPADALTSGMNPFFPDSVLEISRLSPERPDVRREVNALSLFGLGAVGIELEDWRSDSIFSYNGSRTWATKAIGGPYKYVVADTHGPALKTFVGTIARQLPIKPTGHHESRRWLGLKSYFRALHTATDTEERLGQAVASLEAVLLAGEKGELKFRLSLRAAALLRFAGFDATEVFSNMGVAYDFRSAYAHGGQIRTKDLKKANDLCPVIMDYARLTVTKFIEISEAEREAILKSLDLSLVSDVHRGNLQERIAGGHWNCVSRRPTA